MSSTVVADIHTSQTAVQLVKFRPNGRLTTPFRDGAKTTPIESQPIISLYQPTSGTDFDPRCRHSLLLSSAETSRNPFFHQACIFVPHHDELYITSNLLQSTSSSSLPIVLISRVKLHRRNEAGPGDGTNVGDDDVASVEWQKLRPPLEMTMPAGGTAYANGMVFCSQGSLADGSGGLYYMPRGKPPEPLVTRFYGRDFNSPHDVVLTKDGALWFTDPCHGFEKDFRKKPMLPCQVYRFDPEIGDLRVVADGLGRPTGITFSPDEGTAYVTDTDACRGDGELDASRAATIYAYDVLTRGSAPFLSNKRVFACPVSGIPIGIKCDDKGHVYAGCSDGIEIWNESGMLMAVVEIPGGVTNFSFGNCSATKKEMFVCAEQRLWRLQFGEDESQLHMDRSGWLDWSQLTDTVTSSWT
ncbi:unnamed protein product [Discula destructiva]